MNDDYYCRICLKSQVDQQKVCAHCEIACSVVDVKNALILLEHHQYQARQFVNKLRYLIYAYMYAETLLVNKAEVKIYIRDKFAELASWANTTDSLRYICEFVLFQEINTVSKDFLDSLSNSDFYFYVKKIFKESSILATTRTKCEEQYKLACKDFFNLLLSCLPTVIAQLISQYTPLCNCPCAMMTICKKESYLQLNIGCDVKIIFYGEYATCDCCIGAKCNISTCSSSVTDVLKLLPCEKCKQMYCDKCFPYCDSCWMSYRGPKECVNCIQTCPTCLKFVCSRCKPDHNRLCIICNIHKSCMHVRCERKNCIDCKSFCRICQRFTCLLCTDCSATNPQNLYSFIECSSCKNRTCKDCISSNGFCICCVPIPQKSHDSDK